MYNMYTGPSISPAFFLFVCFLENDFDKNCMPQCMPSSALGPRSAKYPLSARAINDVPNIPYPLK